MDIKKEGHKYSWLLESKQDGEQEFVLDFQDGVVPDVGRNGLQNEDVLEALIDRMNWLNGKFPCRENSIVITKLEEALLWLNKRTADRVKRGVEGQHVK